MMATRYKTVGILSTLSVLLLSSAAFADQASHQRVSGSTSASGSNATAVSHTEQSAYQATSDGSNSGTQSLWQGVSVDTTAEGANSTAVTHVTQSATQEVVGSWSDAHAQQLMQSAGIDNAAFDGSTTGSVTQQGSTQVYEGF